MERYIIAKEKLIQAELPEETTTYKPVGHRQLIDLTKECILKAGLHLEREIYSSARDGDVGTGRYFIKNVEDSEMQLQIVWHNSYDKSRSLRYSIGTNILVCTNGMLAYESAMSIKRKHTGDIQIATPEIIPEYINRAGDYFREMQKGRDEMKNFPVNRKLVHELLGRMYFEETFLGSTQLNIIKRELENPTFDYYSKGSLWEMYQFTTYAISGTHPGNWMANHLKAHSFFSNIIRESKSEEMQVLEF